MLKATLPSLGSPNRQRVPVQRRPRIDRPSLLQALLERLSQAIVTHLLINNEPRVWYSCDRNGAIWWHADDPATGRSLRHLSETEMLAWIEQRHYRYEG